MSWTFIVHLLAISNTSVHSCTSINGQPFQIINRALAGNSSAFSRKQVPMSFFSGQTQKYRESTYIQQQIILLVLFAVSDHVLPERAIIQRTTQIYLATALSYHRTLQHQEQGPPFTRTIHLGALLRATSTLYEAQRSGESNSDA